METLYINGENAVLGRLASIVAKKLLEGNRVYIFNAEKIIITGKKKSIVEEYKEKLKIRTLSNPRRGPFHYRLPDRFVRRTIRGMLPWKKPRGRSAYKNLLVYVGIPDEYKNNKLITIEEAKFTTLNPHVTVGELCKLIGWHPPKLA